jgi:hypothetical protein
VLVAEHTKWAHGGRAGKPLPPSPGAFPCPLWNPTTIATLKYVGIYMSKYGIGFVIRWCLKMCCFWIWYLYLGGDDEDDGLDGALEVWCEVILAKVRDHNVFSFFLWSRL